MISSLALVAGSSCGVIALMEKPPQSMVPYTSLCPSLLSAERLICLCKFALKL